MNARRRSRRQASVEYPRHPPIGSNNTLQPQYLPPQVSDYESDPAFAYLSDQPPPPPSQVPSRTVDELNLSVLQRHNRSITTILSVAPYAVIYTFSPSPSPEWIKSGVEGSLFICQLQPGLLGEDRFTAIVLNRRGLENFEAELKEDETGGVELTEEYIIVTSDVNGQPAASGIWIFSEGAGSSTGTIKNLVGQFMRERAVQAGQSRKAAEEALRRQDQSNSGGPTHHQIHHDISAPVSRQISLQEMLGQQRRDDDEWSVRVHSPDGGQAPTHPFRSSGQAQQGPQPAPQHQHQQTVLEPTGDYLRGLFMNAGLSR